jgi:hypothetical protein
VLIFLSCQRFPAPQITPAVKIGTSFFAKNAFCPIEVLDVRMNINKTQNGLFNLKVLADVLKKWAIGMEG